MKSKPTLIFIPDISGFTEFMSSADPEHSNQLIPALLNKIIYSNKINLKVSEIEGDAVFFFKNDGLPPFEDLIEQCEQFYLEFYKKLKQMKSLPETKSEGKLQDILGLKIIIHFGDEVRTVQIGNSIKLMGEDVITAHKLLKNSISEKEYLLISNDLLNQYDENTNFQDSIDWDQLKTGKNSYPHIGDVKYHYVSLEPLKEKITK